MTRTRILAAATALTVLAWPGAAAAAPASNDDFDQATVVSGPLPFADTVPSTDATSAPDDPTACNQDVATVWYSFTPARTGTYVANGTAEPYGADLSIFTGTRGDLTPVLCTSGAGAWSAEAGTTYHLMVSALPWSPPGDLTFSLDGPVRIDVTLDHHGRVDPRTGVARISGTVSCYATGPVRIGGELRQRAGRTVSSGRFSADAPDCDGTSQRWAADVVADSGAFTKGRATARVDVEGCPDAGTCLSDTATATVRLVRAR